MANVIQRKVAVAAGSTNENLLTGSSFEYIRSRSIVQMAILSTDPDTYATVQIGPQVIAEEFTPKQGSDFPTIPDDFFYSSYAVPGDQLKIRARNEDAASQDFYIIVQTTEA